MKKYCLLITVMILFSVFNCAVKQPATYAELAEAYRLAHEAKDISRINSLIYWGSMPETEKTRILGNFQVTFSRKITKVEVAELPADFAMVSGTYVYPFTPEKELEISYDNSANEKGALVGMSFTVGIKDGRAYIVFRSEDVK